VSLSAIRAKIATVMASVDGVENVSQYERWTNDRKTFIARFADDDGIVNAWSITRVRTVSKRIEMPFVHREHTFIVRGIMGLKDSDATELTFQARVEDVQDAFESEYLLSGTCLNSGPMQVKIVEPRIFSGVLCHYAELEYPVSERVTYSI